MLDLANCKECGKLYMAGGSPLCPACLKAEQDQFDLIYTYVRDHANASIPEVAEATGIASKVVLSYLRQGRLLLVQSAPVLACQNCGAPIPIGRFCANCQQKMAKEIDAANQGSDANMTDGRMHSQEPSERNERR